MRRGRATARSWPVSLCTALALGSAGTGACDSSDRHDVVAELADAGDASTHAAGGSPARDAQGEPSARRDAGPGPLDAALPTTPGDARADAGAVDASPDARADAALPVSLYCGDAIRDPVTEECDDGPGDEEDSCTSDCRVRDVAVTPQGGTDAGAAGRFGRSLGVGRHSAAASKRGAGVVYVDDPAGTTVWLQPFDPWGRPNGAPLDATAGGLPVAAPNPVVAALPSGRFAVAWVDGSQGAPDIALRMITAGETPSDTPSFAHEAPAGIEGDPDIVWTGSELVVAWTDSFDLKSRRFDHDLVPLEAEQSLAATAAFEGNVALAPVNGGWAVAWRAGDEGNETVHARMGSTEWTTPSGPPGNEGDHPALMSLDETHLLLVFTVGVYPSGGSATSIGRIRTAVLDVAHPGEVTAEPLAMRTSPYDVDVTFAQGRPDAVRVGEHLFLAWEMQSAMDVPFQTDAWLAEVTWSSSAGLTVLREWRAPRDSLRLGHQKNPSLASSPLFPDGALITVWEDNYGDRSKGASADLSLRFRPVPFVSLTDASTAT